MRYLFNLSLLFVIISITACSDDPDKNKIKVTTLNLRYDNPSDSLNNWNNRKSLVLNYISNSKPDIFGLQEALLNQYEVLDSALSDYGSIAAGREDGANAGEMNPIFFSKSRFDMVRSKTFWLSSTPEIPGSVSWGSSLPRIVSWVELVDKLNHRHFLVFNTHFAHDSDSARIQSSGMLLNSVDSISDGNPFIITGDFNMLPSSTGYKILTGPDESVPLLEDSFTVSGKRPTGPQFTFNGFSDKKGEGRIDYIFVKAGLKVLGHNTEANKVHNVYISDHWPVEAVVSLDVEE